MLTLDFSELKKRAKKASSNRSIRPDIEYIAASAFFTLTILGMPIAYAMMKEYHKYLETCRREYVDHGIPPKGKVFPHTPVTSIIFDYKPKYALKVLKIIWTVLSGSAFYVHYDNLSEEQNTIARHSTEQLKSRFVEVYISYFVALALAFVSVTVSPFFLLGIPVLGAIMVRPFVTYCQALVMYEKVCKEEIHYEYKDWSIFDIPEDDEAHHNEDCNCKDCQTKK